MGNLHFFKEDNDMNKVLYPCLRKNHASLILGSYIFIYGGIDSNNNLWAVNKPEGYIFKWDKNLYQLIYNERQKIIPEKTQLEFLLCDFINYCKTHNYQDKIQTSYVKTVCTLFNDYIINCEEQTHNIENNINFILLKTKLI